jgi:hypothetical protein
VLAQKLVGLELAAVAPANAGAPWRARLSKGKRAEVGKLQPRGWSFLVQRWVANTILIRYFIV